MQKTPDTPRAMTLTIALDQSEGKQLRNMLERVRAERRALMQATEQKYDAQRQKNTQQHQVRDLQRRKLQCLYGGALLLAVVVAFAFGPAKKPSQSNPSSTMTRPAFQLDEATRVKIERKIRSRFMLGEWRFHGARLVLDELRLMVELPAPLQLEAKYQQAYIRQALCPGPHSEIWQWIPADRLSFYLYVENPSDAVFASCGTSEQDAHR